jgi:hypothetical protein
LPLKIKFTEEINKPEVTDKVYYLASPFSDLDPVTEHIRYQDIVEVAYLLNQQGYVLIEPVNMGYPKYTNFKLRGDAKYWEVYNHTLLNKCDGIVVAKLDGYDTSKGVREEIFYARMKGLPIYFVDVERYF